MVLKTLTALGLSWLVGGCAWRQVSVEPALRPEPVWLLGELHDSPHAHRARFRDLEQRVTAGWRPTLVMEQFDREQQPDLDAALARCADPQCVVRAVGGPGWDWALLTPVLALAQQHRLPVVAGNVSRADASRVVREGLSAVLSPALMQRFGLPGSLTPTVQAALEKAVDDGHCGQLPAAWVSRMAMAQVARDVWLAQLVQAHAAQGVVLLAGNGHVRHDLGVPHWLRQIGLTGVWSVGYEEPEAGDQAPQPPAAKRYDQLRSVPPHPRADPCANLRMGTGDRR